MVLPLLLLWGGAGVGVGVEGGVMCQWLCRYFHYKQSPSFAVRSFCVVFRADCVLRDKDGAFPGSPRGQEGLKVGCSIETEGAWRALCGVVATESAADGNYYN